MRYIGMPWGMLCIQVLIYLLCFTAAIAAVVAKGPVGGLFFYPGPVQQRALELGLTNEATVRRRKKWFFTALVIGIAEIAVLVGRAV